MFHTPVHKIPKTLGDVIEKDTPKDSRKEKLEHLISVFEVFVSEKGSMHIGTLTTVLNKLKELR